MDWDNKEYWGYMGSGSWRYSKTATKNGILTGYLSEYGSAVDIFMNGITIGTMTNNQTGGGSAASSFFHIINKDETVTFVASGSNATNAVVYFVPFK